MYTLSYVKGLSILAHKCRQSNSHYYWYAKYCSAGFLDSKVIHDTRHNVLFFKNTNLISWNMHQVCKQLVQGWQHFLPLCQSAPNMALDFYLQRNITKKLTLAMENNSSFVVKTHTRISS